MPTVDSPDPGGLDSGERAGSALGQVLENRRMLLVLDDIWSQDASQPHTNRHSAETIVNRTGRLRITSCVR